MVQSPWRMQGQEGLVLLWLRGPWRHLTSGILEPGGTISLASPPLQVEGTGIPTRTGLPREPAKRVTERGEDAGPDVRGGWGL